MKHFHCYLALILTMFPILAQARNPFQQPKSILCFEQHQKQQIMIEAWQFRGVVAQNNQFSALIFDAKNHVWHILKPNQFLLPTYWFVKKMTFDTLTLAFSSHDFCDVMIEKQVTLQ